MITTSDIRWIERGRIVMLILLFALSASGIMAQRPDSLQTTLPGSFKEGRTPRAVQQFSGSDQLPDTLLPQAGNENPFTEADSAAMTELPESGKVKREKKGRRDRVSPDGDEHSPRKAIIYSAVLPGLGQAYNRSYFKIPIVYAAIGGAGYLIYYNNDGYRNAIEEYNLDPSDLNERIVRAWRRNLEISVLVTGAVYGLQIIDAYVDANLFYWDVDPDLTVRVEPRFSPIVAPGFISYSYGLTCSLTF